MIAAGRMDQRITIQRRVSGVDAYGQESQGWLDVVTIWAEAMTKRGREYIAAGQQQASALVVFRVRYRADLLQDSSMRVVWGGVAYDVVEPPQDVNGQKTMIEIPCASGMRDG